MKAKYYRSQKALIIENGLRGFGNVPELNDFKDHPPVSRFLNVSTLYDNTLIVEVVE